MSTTKKLTKTEFYKLQWYNERAENNKLATQIVRKELEIKHLKRALLQYKIKDEDLEITSLEREQKHLITQAKELKSEQSEILNTVRKRLKLNGRFGYDEETLEVIED